VSKSLPDSLRQLNRLPWVVGLLGLVAFALAVVVLIFGGWRWDMAVIGLSSLMLGVALMALYYWAQSH
jgi:hypothetical protein